MLIEESLRVRQPAASPGAAGEAGMLVLIVTEGEWPGRRIAIGAALIETAIGLAIETRDDPREAPLTRGRSGLITRLGGVLSGPVPLALRVLGRSPNARRLAAASTLAGSMLTRLGWIEAGRDSSRTPAGRLPSGDGHERAGLRSLGTSPDR